MKRALSALLPAVSASLAPLRHMASALASAFPPLQPPAAGAAALAGADSCGPLPWLRRSEAAAGSEEEELEAGEQQRSGASSGGLAGLLLRRPGSALGALAESIWLAVPKRKKSYSKKRQRQMNPLYASKNVQNFYPCPKCEKGFLKLRHHVCPCDQERANVCGVRKVRAQLGLLLLPTWRAPRFGGLQA